MPIPEPAPLHVLVTRPADQAQGLCEGIRQLGARPIRLPLLEIQPLSPDSSRDLSSTDMLIFISVNAVIHGLGWLKNRPTGLMLGAMGQATAARLQAAGVAVDLLPASFDTEGMLALPALQQAAGKQIVIVRGQGGRETLAQHLRERGATVSYLEVYRRACPHWQQADVDTALRSDIITVTSADALDNLAQLAQLPGAADILSRPLLVFHERIAGRAHELGFTLKARVTEKPGDAAMLSALRDWIIQTQR